MEFMLVITELAVLSFRIQISGYLDYAKGLGLVLVASLALRHLINVHVYTSKGLVRNLPHILAIVIGNT